MTAVTLIWCVFTIAVMAGAFETFGCLVIIVHHCGLDGSRSRGHTSLTCNAEAELQVSRDEAQNVVVEVKLMKDGPAGDQVVSRLEDVVIGVDEDGEELKSLVIIPADAILAAKRKPKLSGHAEIVWRSLHDAILDEGFNPIPNRRAPRGTKVCKIETWRKYAYASVGTDGDTRKKTFARAKTKLQVTNLIGVWDDTVWIAGQAGQDGT
jgi:hypothetical protein